MTPTFKSFCWLILKLMVVTLFLAPFAGALVNTLSQH